MYLNIIDRSAAGDEVVFSVSMADAVDQIDALAGRTIGAYVIGQAHANRRRGKREGAYVAASRSSYWREIRRSQGFHIEIVRPIGPCMP